jgi:hypothetical protein
LLYLKNQAQNQNQYQNYVKTNTKTGKTISKPIPKLAKPYQNRQNHNKTNTKTSKTISKPIFKTKIPKLVLDLVHTYTREIFFYIILCLSDVFFNVVDIFCKFLVFFFVVFFLHVVHLKFYHILLTELIAVVRDKYSAKEKFPICIITLKQHTFSAENDFFLFSISK